MNCENSLTQLIKSTFNISVRSVYFKPLFNATLEYVLGYVREKDYHTKLSKIGVEFPEGLSYKGFRLLVRETSNIMVNVKYYATYFVLARGKNFTKEHAEAIYPKYKICKSDAVMSWRFANQFKKVSRRGNKFFENLSIDNVTYVALRDYEIALQEMLSELITFSKRVAYKKLRFISKNSSESTDSMAAELMTGAVRAYMGMSPQIVYQERAYQLNRLRTSINNYSVNFIEAHTKQSKARLINVGKDNKQNAKFVVVENNFSGFAHDEEGNSIYSAVEDPKSKRSDLLDLEIAVNRLIDRNKGKRKAELLRVMFNRSCTRFIKYLRSNNLLTSICKDTHDVIGKLGRGKFFDALSKYLSVKKEAIFDYLDQLKTDLNIGEVIHAA